MGVDAGSERGGGNRGPGPVNADWGGGAGLVSAGPGFGLAGAGEWGFGAGASLLWVGLLGEVRIACSDPRY